MEIEYIGLYFGAERFKGQTDAWRFVVDFLPSNLSLFNLWAFWGIEQMCTRFRGGNVKENCINYHISDSDQDTNSFKQINYKLSDEFILKSYNKLMIYKSFE